MILAALDEVGGHWYLVEQARANPSAFLTLVGKVLPMQVNTTVKRDIRDLSYDELLAIASGAGIAGPTSGEEEDRAVH